MSALDLYVVQDVPLRVEELIADNARLRGENEALQDALRAIYDQARSSIRNAPGGEDYACAGFDMLAAMAEKGLGT